MENQEIQKNLPLFGIGKVLPYLKNYKKALFGMMIGCLVGSVVDVGVPLFQRYALNHFIGEGTLDTLAVYILLYLLMIVGAAAVNYVACVFSMSIEVGVDRDLRNAAFAHLQTLSFSYFNQNSVGYIHSRVMSDTQRIGSLVSWTLLDSIWQFGYVIGAVVVMLVIDTRLALMVIAVLPLTVLFFSLFQSRLTKVNREIRELNSQITGDFIQITAHGLQIAPCNGCHAVVERGLTVFVHGIQKRGEPVFLVIAKEPALLDCQFLDALDVIVLKRRNRAQQQCGHELQLETQVVFGGAVVVGQVKVFRAIVFQGSVACILHHDLRRAGEHRPGRIDPDGSAGGGPARRHGRLRGH